MPSNPSSGRQPGKSPSGRRRRPVRWLALVVIATAIVTVVVLASGLSILLIFTQSAEPLNPAERELLVDARDLTAQIDDYQPDFAREASWRRQRGDAQYELDYRYDDRPAVYLHCAISVKPSPAKAQSAYEAAWAAAATQDSPWPAAEPIDLVEHGDWFTWGDRSRLAVVHMGRRAVGNVFVARKGRVIFTLAVAGVCIERPEAFRLLVGPALARVDRYDF